MAIRTDNPDINSSSVILLPEDKGLCKFLPLVLETTSIASARHDVHVLGGGGWTAVYQQHSSLVASGISIDRIIPVLDADQVKSKGPTSDIHSNPNLPYAYRFQADFEFEFGFPESLLLDHALQILLPDLFEVYGDIQGLVKWKTIARSAFLKTHHEGGTTLDNVKKEIVAAGIPEEQLVIPSKVKLAEVLAELCISTGALPSSIDKLLLNIEARANGRNLTTFPSYSIKSRPLWMAPLARTLPKPAQHLQGKVLYSPQNGGLQYVDLSAENRITTLSQPEDITDGGWLPDGRIGATIPPVSGVVIIDPQHPGQRITLSRGMRESYRGWDQGANRVLLRAVAGTPQMFSVSLDNISWSEVNAVGHNHCLSSQRRLAWSRNAMYPNMPGTHDIVFVRGIDAPEDKAVKVPDVIDASFSLAWSHNGGELAFVNAEKDLLRCSICIWNLEAKKTRFITPWLGPQFQVISHIAWSPDDKYIIFTMSAHPGLFLVETQSHARSGSEILCLSHNGGSFLSDAWQQ